MSAQSEALRLADSISRIDTLTDHQRRELLHAAAELRRLHQFAEDQIGRATAAEAALQMTRATHALKIAAVEAQRDALLEALKELTGHTNKRFTGGVWDRARAAIKAVEGENT